MNFIPHASLDFLCWVPRECLVRHTQNDKYQLEEDFDVCLHAKNKLHHSLLLWDIVFYRILQFDWLITFGHTTREPEFCQGIGDEVSINVLVFTLYCFQEKLIQFFKKSKKPNFGANLDAFCPKLGKNEFSWENRLCQFLKIPIIYHHAKNQKKLMSHSSEKYRTDRRTDRQTDRHRYNGDFIGHSLRRGPTNDW